MADCTPPEDQYYWRHLAGFWVCGLINNFTYVVFLTGAEDLLTGYSGAILLANILPTLVVKSTAPLYVHRLGYRPRVLAMVAAFLCSYLVVALAGSWSAPTPSGAREAGILLGIATASAASGLGELTFLACTARFHRDTVGAWSSGTGGAGLVGASAWVFLRHMLGLPTVHSLLLMAPVPLILAAAFFGLLDHGADLRPQATLVATAPRVIAKAPPTGSRAHQPPRAGSDVPSNVSSSTQPAEEEEEEEDGERRVKEPLLGRYSDQEGGYSEHDQGRPGDVRKAMGPQAGEQGSGLRGSSSRSHAARGTGGESHASGGDNAGCDKQGHQQGQLAMGLNGGMTASQSTRGGGGGRVAATVVDVGHGGERGTVRHLLALAPFLCRYMVPLMLVYFFEYLINQAMFLPLGFAVYGTGVPGKGGQHGGPPLAGGGGPPPASPPSSASHDACVMYSILQTTYQLGVFLSRSSLRVFPVRRVWTLPVFQGFNVLIVLARILAVSHGAPPPIAGNGPEGHRSTLEITALYALVLWEGLLGGAAYVNVFFLLSKNAADEDRYVCVVAPHRASASLLFCGDLQHYRH
eukprot:jgi/Mesvir1/9847/Mv22387-RA.6